MLKPRFFISLQIAYLHFPKISLFSTSTVKMSLPNLESSIPNTCASQPAEMFWKNIWWIQVIAFVVTFLTIHLSFKAMFALIRLFIKNSDECDNATAHLSWSPIEDFSTENPTITGSQRGHFNANDGKSNKWSDSNRLETIRSEIGEFYDLSHHGIQFYNDNLSMSSRQRIPRMHSTVTDATLVSMMRNRKFPGGPTPPAFPKFQAPINVNDKISLKNQFCSGDARFATNIDPASERLSTVVEEERSDGVMSSDRLSCKSEPSGRKKQEYSNVLKMATNRFTCTIPKANFVVMKRHLHSLTPAVVIGKTGYAKSENDYQKPTECEFPFPADYDTTEDILCTEPVQLECLICKDKLQCVCDKCSSLGTAFQYEKKEIHQDCSGPQEEFIDDNFEDMESLLSDEVTNCSNM